jgi:hypothetical protein
MVGMGWALMRPPRAFFGYTISRLVSLVVGVTFAAAPALGGVLSPPAVYVDAAGTCGGQTPCFTTIQAGVNHATPSSDFSALVIVFPGIYPESVDLSLMGSAVGGMPDDILIGTGTSFESLINAAFGTPNPPTSTVNPAAGPAFFNSVSPFPGAISMIAFNVVSKTTHGLDLHADDNMGMFAMIADGNFADGMKLQTDGDAQVSVIGSHADMNGAIGIDVNAGGVASFGFPFLPDTAPDSLGPMASAMMNEAHNALSRAMAPFGITSAPVTTIFAPFQVSANGNKSIGVHVVAGESAFLEGVTANKNGSFGIDVDSPSSATFVFDSADENKGSGFHVSSPNDLAVFVRVTALTNNPGDGITVASAQAAIVLASYVASNSDDGVHMLNLGTPPSGFSNEVVGGIVCNNGGAGLRLESNVDVTATGDWWGASSGPFHSTKNPTGTGNAVVDGSSGGGMGDVTFIPFIDTASANLVGEARVGVPDPRSVQFSGGGGTVFLGSGAFPFLTDFGGPGDPLGELPFIVTTDNGVVTASLGAIIGTPIGEETGPSIGAAINQPQGKLRFSLVAAHDGLATITVNGPCGLSLAQPIVLHVIHLAVPALSGIALLLLGSLLAWRGSQMVRRRRSPLGQ